MKHTILASLFLAAVGVSATGCIIHTDDGDPRPLPQQPEDEATITTTWKFRTVAGAILPCPAGVTIVESIAQELDASDRLIGAPIIDRYNCSEGRHDSEPLPPARYEVYLRAGTPTTTYATSLASVLDVTNQNKTFNAEIVDDGGYFKLAWDLKNATSNAAITCETLADLASIEITSTLSSPNTLFSERFDCDSGEAITEAMPAGTYQLSIVAVEPGTPNPVPAGPATEVDDAVIEAKNKVTDLGVLEIAVTP